MDIVVFPPRFSHLKMGNFTSRWIKNREGLGPTTSQAMMSKQEKPKQTNGNEKKK